MRYDRVLIVTAASPIPSGKLASKLPSIFSTAYA
jgi:hypothetical protein